MGGSRLFAKPELQIDENDKLFHGRTTLLSVDYGCVIGITELADLRGAGLVGGKSDY